MTETPPRDRSFPSTGKVGRAVRRGSEGVQRPAETTIMLARARHLRQSMTEEERWLWTELRSLKKQGFKFRRQVPLGRYICDFVCFRSRLIIELDGSQHGQPENRAYDKNRDAWLTSQDFEVMRFGNADVRLNVDAVVEAIFQAAQSRLDVAPPQTRRRRASSPVKGEQLRELKVEQ